MPHLVIEYAADMKLNAGDLVRYAHHAAVTSGLFQAADIKTRAIAVQDYIAGDKGLGFVHVTLYLLDGRTLVQKQQLSEHILDALTPLMEAGQSLSVDVRELMRDVYRKRII